MVLPVEVSERGAFALETTKEAGISYHEVRSQHAFQSAGVVTTG